MASRCPPPTRRPILPRATRWARPRPRRRSRSPRRSDRDQSGLIAAARQRLKRVDVGGGEHAPRHVEAEAGAGEGGEVLAPMRRLFFLRPIRPQAAPPRQRAGGKKIARALLVVETLERGVDELGADTLHRELAANAIARRT